MKADRTPNEEDFLVASKLKGFRQLRDMSQQFVADKIDVSSQQIQKYETGKNRVSAGRLNILANLFGVPSAYFFDDETAGISEVMKLVGNLDTRQLVHAFATIKQPALRHAILVMVKTTAETAQYADLPVSPQRTAALDATLPI